MESKNFTFSITATDKCGKTFYSIQGLTAEDLTILSLAISPNIKELGQRLDEMRNPTIRYLFETFPLGKLPDLEKIQLRLFELKELLSTCSPNNFPHVSINPVY